MQVNYNDIKSVDLRIVLMCDLGFYGKMIAQKTGLTVSQVYYRTRRAGRKFRDYRDGNSWAAQAAIRQLGTAANMEQLKTQVRAYLEKNKKG